MKETSEQVAVVTGGGRNIGLACAHALAEAGALPVLAEIDREIVREEAVEPVGDHGYQMDIRSEFPTISKGFRVQAGCM